MGGPVGDLKDIIEDGGGTDDEQTKGKESIEAT